VEQPFADEEDEGEAWQQAASRRAGHAISLHSCARRLTGLSHDRPSTPTPGRYSLATRRCS
jgi:hypothetical protein